MRTAVRGWVTARHGRGELVVKGAISALEPRLSSWELPDRDAVNQPASCRIR